MAALQNYIDLRFAVSDHVGNRAISDVFPRLVEMAESDLNSRLRTRQQLTDATLFFEDGVSPLPPDFLEIFSVSGCGSAQFQVGSFNITIPGCAGEREMQYYAALPSLTCGSTATNWLLRSNPAVYLYGVGLQAAKHLRDVDLTTATAALYGEELKRVRVDDNAARWGAAVVRVEGPTP